MRSNRANASSGTLLIDMSTIRPETSVAVAKAGGERGIAVLDAPVSGGEAGDSAAHDHDCRVASRRCRQSSRLASA